MQALVLVDHGSRRAEANQVVAAVGELLRARVGDGAIVRCAHMELASPSLPEAIDACVGDGASHIKICPYFLGPGRHVSVDIPRILAECRQERPGVEMALCPPLGVHPALVEVILARAFPDR